MQVCADPRVTGLSVGPAQFGLELPDGSRHAGITGGVSPALRAQNVADGQCVRGWVSVPVPKSPDPRYITAQLPGYDEAHWVFPGLEPRPRRREPNTLVAAGRVRPHLAVLIYRHPHCRYHRSALLSHQGHGDARATPAERRR